MTRYDLGLVGVAVKSSYGDDVVEIDILEKELRQYFEGLCKEANQISNVSIMAGALQFINP